MISGSNPALQRAEKQIKGAITTPVFPDLILRSGDGWRSEFLLRLRNGRSAYVVQLSLEQAMILAVEMRRLATDHFPIHHLAVRVAEGLKAKISHVVIRRSREGDDVVGVLRLIPADWMQSIQADAATGLATGIHMGIPIFMDGELSLEEQDREEHVHDVPDDEAVARADKEMPDGGEEIEPGVITSTPWDFQDLIDALGRPDGRSRTDGGTAPEE